MRLENMFCGDQRCRGDQHCQFVRYLGLMVWCVVLGAGCGKSQAPVPPATQAPPAATDTSAPVASSETQASVSTPKSTPRRMVGDIPLDVWFDDPLGELKKTDTVGGGAVADIKPTAPATTQEPPPAMEEKPKETAAPVDWASVISLDDLQEETKTIRLEMQKHLVSVQVYNGNFKENIAPDATVLSAVAAIALVHPEKISWKDHAAHVRDLAAELAKKAKGLGQKPFDETKQEFEKIDGILGGNPPPDIGEAIADLPFSEVISRRGIMKRLQKSSDELRANYQSEAALEKAQDQAAHTASMVAALTKIIGTEGYSSADEDEYQEFVKGLMEANLTMARAAREKDFTAFSEANGRVITFCNGCHNAYQGSSE